jgi:ribonuclease E
MGVVRSTEASAVYYLRKIWLVLDKKEVATVRGTLSLDVANYLLNQKRPDLNHLEDRYQTTIIIEGSASILPHEGKLEFIPREPASSATA